MTALGLIMRLVHNIFIQFTMNGSIKFEKKEKERKKTTT